MVKEQAIKVIEQMLDTYREDESNWESVPKQDIYVEGYDDDGSYNTYIIEGKAEWLDCCLTRSIGDEEIPTEYFEPVLNTLECRLKGYDIDGNELYNEPINESDL